jgi:hypothetical protein
MGVKMNKLPKFPKNNPSNKEEKLIMELVGQLRKTSNNFIESNYKIITNETYNVLRDAAINYAGGIVHDLIKILIDENRIPYFAADAKLIFGSCIDQIMDEYK